MMKIKILITLIAITSLTAIKAQNTINPDAVNPDWKKEVPTIVHPDKKLVELYNKTWEIAAGRVRKGPEGMVATPYLDENCYDDQIWIWDACFMTMFSKYAPQAYPGKQTLFNFYRPILDKEPTPLRIHLRDNPPLFAWVENDYFEFTGDKKHIDDVLNKMQYLQRHFNYFDSIPKGDVNNSLSPNPINRGVVRDASNKIIGYTWTGGASGMDNTPRGLDCGGYNKIMWIDAICQQALSALYISRISEKLGHKTEAKIWKEKYNQLKNTINTKYWNEEDGFYYDVEIATGKHCKVKTMASYWALLAEVASPQQAKRMVAILQNEKYFGSKYPFTSLSRDDKYFNAATGDYWRGGIWLPMAYMGVKALEKYGYFDIADTMANNVVQQQLRTYFNYSPHTIWEVYNPIKDEPSTEVGRIARPDFCGWSALGPISLTIENILGFRKVDALSHTIYWDLNKENKTHGIQHLRFSNIDTDIIYNHQTGKITATTNRPFTLVVNNKKYKVSKKHTVFKVI